MTILFQENVCLFLQTANKKLPYYQMFSFAAKREERREEKTSGTQFQNSKILFSRVHFHTVEFDKTMEIAFPTFFDNISISWVQFFQLCRMSGII